MDSVDTGTVGGAVSVVVEEAGCTAAHARDTDGGAATESLGVSSPPFIQYLRAAEKTRFEAVLERTDDLD